MATPETAKIPATAATYVAKTIQTRGGCSRSGAPSARMPHVVDRRSARAREEEEHARRQQRDVQVQFVEGIAGPLDHERDHRELDGDEQADPAAEKSREQGEASR